MFIFGEWRHGSAWVAGSFGFWGLLFKLRLFFFVYRYFMAATSSSCPSKYEAWWSASSKDIVSRADIFPWILMKSILHSSVLKGPLLRLVVRSWLWYPWTWWCTISCLVSGSKNRFLLLLFLWRTSIALGTHISVEWSYRWNFLRVMQTILKQVWSGFGKETSITSLFFFVI